MGRLFRTIVEICCAIVGINPEWVLGSQNPTKDFGEAFRQELNWDFESKRLNGIPFGAPVDALEFLGAADHYERSELISGYHTLTYGRSGLVIGLTENDDGEKNVDYFGIITGPDKYSQIPGITISLNGLILKPGDMLLDSKTSPETLDEIFTGVEVEIDDDTIDDDSEESVRTYIFDSIEYEFEFQSPKGDLKRINIYPEND